MIVFWTWLGCWLLLSLAGSISLGFSWAILLSTAVTVTVLVVVGIGSGQRGWPLFRLIALLYAGIAVVNIHIESFVLSMFPLADIVWSGIIGLALALSVSAALTVGLSRRSTIRGLARSGRLAGSPAVRLPAVAIAYVALYFVAGLLIWPFVQDFYMNSRSLAMPSLGLIMSTQFVRGLVYAIVLVPLFLALQGYRRRGALLAGLALSMLGGVAPLLMPVDAVLPWAVRRIHMVEILWSNFALGAVAAWLLVRPRTPEIAA